MNKANNKYDIYLATMPDDSYKSSAPVLTNVSGQEFFDWFNEQAHSSTLVNVCLAGSTDLHRVYSLADYTA